MLSLTDTAQCRAERRRGDGGAKLSAAEEGGEISRGYDGLWWWWGYRRLVVSLLIIFIVLPWQFFCAGPVAGSVWEALQSPPQWPLANNR